MVNKSLSYKKHTQQQTLHQDVMVNSMKGYNIMTPPNKTV